MTNKDIFQERMLDLMKKFSEASKNGDLEGMAEAFMSAISLNNIMSYNAAFSYNSTKEENNKTK